MENLDEKMNEFLESEMPTAEAGFVVDTSEKADWCIKKAVEAESKLAELAEYKLAKLEELDRFIEKESKQYQDTIERMEYLLRPYIEKQLVGSKKKSVNFVNGSAGYRSVPAKFEFEQSKLLEWVKVNAPTMVITKESVNWAELKKQVALDADKVISQDGEVIPGVTVTEEEHDKFYIK